MKLLLTGANGFVGSHILDLLRTSGHDVTLLLRPTSDTRFIDTHMPDVEIYYGSLGEELVLENAIRGVEGVIHCAGKTKAVHASEYDRVNRDGTRNLVAVANKLRDTLRHLVLISSLAATGPSDGSRPCLETDPPNPVSAYGKSKLAAEKVMTDDCEIPWTILRPAAVYGPRDRDFLSTFRAVKRHVIPVPGGGNKRFSLIYVRDVAEAVCKCLGRTEVLGHVYHLAAEPPCAALELLEEIKTQLDVRALHLPVAAPILYLLCMMHQLASRITGRSNILSRDKWVELRAPGWECAVRAIREDIGFVASTPLSEGIRQTLAWYRQQGWL